MLDKLGSCVIAHHVHAVAPFDEGQAFDRQALEFDGFHLGAVLLALEAALRLLDPDPQPLVVVLPPGWSPDDPGEVFEELDTSWVDLDTVADAVSDVEATEVAAGDLRYPDSQQSSELDAGAVAAVQDLVDAGEVLQDVLTLNDRVGDVVAGEAFAAAAYTTRPVGRARA